MKLLLSSHAFHPSIGGIETASRLLAEEFVAAGHSVRVVTQTADSGERAFSFPLLRRPSPRALFAAVRWCDVFFHNNISLQTAWPLLVLRRPWVVTHQTWIPRAGLVGKMKRFALRRACSVAISRAVARDCGGPCAIIPNPYQDDLFRLLPDVARDRELIFVGRLVSDKGADILLRALSLLAQNGRRARLTIAGSGPEDSRLRELARELGVTEQVTFSGALAGEPLVRALNAHRILVVPSRWAEPFGIVALEGIACGCFVIGSEEGGLPEAIGPCGATFPNGDAAALAAQIERAVSVPPLHDARPHLARHRRGVVAAKYLALMSRLVA